MENTIKKRITKKPFLPQVPEKQLNQIAYLLYDKFRKEQNKNQYASIKLILSYLAKGGYMAAALMMPGLTRLAPDVLGTKQDWEKWKQFNQTYLRRSLLRLQKQKLVEVGDEGNKTSIRISQAGKCRILKYSLEELEINKPKNWDGCWRLIIYDVSAKKRYYQNLFRREFKRLGFYQLQKSVFLTPYPCQKEIDFLREYFDVGNEVLYLTVNRFENDQPYRKYFGIE